MSRIKLQTVGQLAKRSGVTVRTLHHYDEIGLLSPATRETGGRRLYDRDDVLRLQQILTYRMLGLGLDAIARVLDDPGFDRRAALLAQRKALAEQIDQCEALIRGIDAALALDAAGIRKDMDMTTLFGGFDPRKFEDETRQRWGETAAYASLQRRVARYGQAEWARYHAAHQAICRSFAALAADGAAPGGGAALAQARAYAALVDEWFYPCNAAHLAGLADMYEEDARFRASFDAYGPGTAAFVIGAFRACAGTASGAPASSR